MSSEPNVRHVGHAADRAITQFADRGIECFGVNIAKQHACARPIPEAAPITTAPLAFNSSCIFKYL